MLTMKTPYKIIAMAEGRKRRASIYALYVKAGLSIAEVAALNEITYERARQIIRKAEQDIKLGARSLT